METSLYSQLLMLTMSAAVGFACGCIYDIFKVIRHRLHYKGLMVGMIDLIYCLLVIFAVSLLNFGVFNGEIRWVSSICIVCGMVIYFATAAPAMNMLIKALLGRLFKNKS